MTEWINGSKVEVVSGTVISHGGPHRPGCGHDYLPMDEIELMSPETYDDGYILNRQQIEKLR